MYLHTECSCICIVPLCVSRAAKVQRLEKEQTEMKKSLESLRQAKVEAEEVGKTNQKLNDQACEYRTVIVKLKEVRTYN